MRISASATRGLLAAGLALALFAATPPPPQPGLYQSVFVVTGTKEKNRMTGFAETFRQVLVKLSGDPRLADDPKVAELMKDAAAYVTGFSYLDLKDGIKLSDEQGSYDRPHYLTVDFDHARIDAVLAALGRKPWLERPTVAVFLGVDRTGKRYVVDATSDRDAAMRESFANAARRYGVKILFPEYPVAISKTRNFDAWMKPDEVDLNAAAKAAGGGSGLVGTLIWSDAEHGWIASWRVQAGERQVSWQLRGVSFDDAFRNGLAGAAQVFSGNGQPGATPP